jgi:hypothetical protein
MAARKSHNQTNLYVLDADTDDSSNPTKQQLENNVNHQSLLNKSNSELNQEHLNDSSNK